MVHYELYVRQSDAQSDRILTTFIERGLAFVEIQLSEEEAKRIEAEHGRTLPLVMHGGQLIGGYSDLVIHLRLPIHGRPSGYRVWR